MSHDPSDICPWNDAALCPDCAKDAAQDAQNRARLHQALDRLEHSLHGTIPPLTRRQLAEALNCIAAELQGMALALTFIPPSEEPDDAA